MHSPLDSFADQMIDFQVFRDSKLLYTVPGLKNTEKSSGRKIIEFYPEVNIQVGDVLVNSNIKYYIVDMDTQTWQGAISAFKAYYQTIQPSSNSNQVTYNITNPSNSIIGNQQSAIINNKNFNVDDLIQLIDKYGENDKQRLTELSEALKDCLDNDEFHKGKLSKFGDLIAKHSWLPLAISQIIAGYLQSL